MAALNSQVLPKALTATLLPPLAESKPAPTDPLKTMTVVMVVMVVTVVTVTAMVKAMVMVKAMATAMATGMATAMVTAMVISLSSSTDPLPALTTASKMAALTARRPTMRATIP